jgi:hypothetical protein
MNRIVFCTTLALTTAPFALQGADVRDNPNRLSLGPRFGFNFKAHFSNTPAPFPANPGINPGAPIGGADHTYDDGYVRVDSSGNAAGSTWNWGYQNASQVVGDSMRFHARQPNPAFGPLNTRATGDPQFGGELTYQRIVCPIGTCGFWGIEGALSVTDLDLRGRAAGAGPFSVTTDRFALNGVIPPGAGYNGTFTGSGALLADTFGRTVASDALTSRESLSGQIFGLRMGPFAGWNLTSRLSLAASAGLTLAPAVVDYNFSETTLHALGGTSTATGSSTKTRLLYGPYAGATLRYELNQNWGVYAGAQFQRLNDLEQSIGARRARLDQSATFFGTAGVSFRF